MIELLKGALKLFIDGVKTLSPSDLTEEFKQHVRDAFLELDLGLIEIEENKALDDAVPPQ